MKASSLVSDVILLLAFSCSGHAGTKEFDNDHTFKPIDIFQLEYASDPQISLMAEKSFMYTFSWPS